MRILAMAAMLFAAAGCGERAGDAPRVLFLNPLGNPANQGPDNFRQAFERKVVPFHPRARLDLQETPADTLDEAARAIAPHRSKPPAVVVTNHTTIAQAVARELPATPLVLLTMADPMMLGISDDPVAPRTDVSGYTSNVPYELKHMELLAEFAPRIRRVGVISDRFWASGSVERRLLEESRELFGLEAQLVVTETPEAVGGIADHGRRAGIDAWFVPDTPFNRIHAAEIARQIFASGKLSIGGSPRYAKAGGVLAYYAVPVDHWPRLAQIVNLVLSGVPAREIPFERPKQFRVVVNRERARELGVEIPATLLRRADEILP
jgi:putative ABC transport system substrate-binding protein